ncbi:MAG TPA: DinB family protein [Terriglobia bacterium]|nr:DinB family protein [Terriglobia bacterium]
MTPESAKVLCKVFTDTSASEAETTKKVFRAVPDDKKSYKPDPKSMTAHELAWHIASAEIMFYDMVLTGKGPSGPPPAAPPTIGAILDWYETNHRDRVAKVNALPGEKLAENLQFFGVMNFPAVMYLDMMNRHAIHHRGQLSTYLRPMGSKVPAIYGGSADEPMKG